jgi:hypothetical protein
MASPIVTLLSSRPSGELESLRKRMKSEREKLTEEIARIDIELRQVNDALARQTRRKPAKGARAAAAPPAWVRVLQVIESADGPVSPADAAAALQQSGYKGTKSAIYNAFKRLSDAGKIEKVGDGLYKFASSNGKSWNEPW